MTNLKQNCYIFIDFVETGLSFQIYYLILKTENEGYLNASIFIKT